MPKTAISKARLLGRNVLMKLPGLGEFLGTSKEKFQPLVRVQWNINLEPPQTHADLFNRGRLLLCRLASARYCSFVQQFQRSAFLSSLSVFARQNDGIFKAANFRRSPVPYPKTFESSKHRRNLKYILCTHLRRINVSARWLEHRGRCH